MTDAAEAPREGTVNPWLPIHDGVREISMQEGRIVILHDPALIDEDFNPTGVTIGFWDAEKSEWVGTAWDGCNDYTCRARITPTHFWVAIGPSEAPWLWQELDHTDPHQGPPYPVPVIAPELIDADFNTLGISTGWWSYELHTEDVEDSDVPTPGWMAVGWDANSDEPTDLRVRPTHFMDVQLPNFYDEELRALAIAMGAQRLGC